MAQPLFLLAAPRSGSTFFGKALSRCPGIGMTNEAALGYGEE